MTIENKFEVALRSKMRYPFRGLISTEDLFDLSLTNLDSIFKTLNSELKQVKEESLLDTKTKEDKELDIKIEIVKYVVAEKIKESEAKANEKAIKEQQQKIMEILSTKQDESLQNKTVEELQAMLGDLSK